MICLSPNNHTRTRFSGTVFAVISLLSIVTISKRCFLEVPFVQSLAYGVQSSIFKGYIPPSPLVHSCQSIKYSLQSFKGCTSPELLVQLSVRSQSSKGGLFLLLMQLSVYQARSTIIQRMHYSGIARAVICLLECARQMPPMQTISYAPHNSMLKSRRPIPGQCKAPTHLNGRKQ